MPETEFHCIINMPIRHGQGLLERPHEFAAEIVALSLREDGWWIHLMKSFGPHSAGASYKPQEVLDWTPWTREDGSHGPSPGHFKINCRQLGCEWIIPLVEGMAAGDKVAPDEVLLRFRERYGCEPITGWREMESSWRRLSLEYPEAQQAAP